MRDLAFVASWVVLLPLALQGAQLGVLLWSWTSLLAPNDVLYGFGIDVPFSKLAAVVTLAMLLFGHGSNVRLRFDSTVLLLASLALLGLVSQADCLAADPSPGWVIYEDFAKVLLLAMIARGVMCDRVRLHAMLLVICLGIGFTSVGEAGKFLMSGGGHKVLGSASIGDNNRIALSALLIMPLLHYLRATARLRAVRVCCIAGIVMNAICIVATASRAGFVGLVVLAVVFALTSRRKIGGLLLVAALALAGAQLVSESWVERMNTIQSAEDDRSFMGRVGAWKIATVIAIERPLVGGGFHATEHPEVWGPRVPAAVQLGVLDSAPLSVARAAHSIYFEVLGDLGFLGLGLFVGLVLLSSRNAAAVRRRVRQSGRSDLAWATAMAGALQVTVVLFLVVGASLSTAYHDIDYLPIAMLAALRDVVERASRETAPNILPDRRTAMWAGPAIAGKPVRLTQPHETDTATHGA